MVERLLLVALCLAAPASAAQSSSALFRELATPGTSGKRRDAIVEELSARPFAEAGPPAVQMIGRSDGRSIYNPSTDKPWLEERCSEGEKARYAAVEIWNSVIERAGAGSLAEPLVALILESRSDFERLTYLSAVLNRHYDDRVKAPLERLARDSSQPPEIGLKAAAILVHRVDANGYFADLLAACSRIPEPLTRAGRFRDSTDRLAETLSEDNRRRLLRYGFALLDEIDDGKAGHGYFLALYLGDVLGIGPMFGGRSAFVPNQDLPQYQGEAELKDCFFEDTVANARAWWREQQNRR